jgi:signal transduction histidine kinase/ligand-binding sensor domain-containing protein
MLIEENTVSPRPVPASGHGPRSALSALVLLFVLQAVFAATPRYHIDVWTTENGLPQNVVRAACQTPDGYLWIATLDGLARFDGVRFVVLNRSNTPGIASGRFTSLYCAPNGEFWAGTESSGITHYKHGEFTTYATAEGLPYSDFVAVVGDGNDHVWVLVHTSIARWNGSAFEAVPLSGDEAKCQFHPLGRSGFWCIQERNLRLYVRGESLRLPLPSDWPLQGWTSAREDQSGVLWLAHGSGRIAKRIAGKWLELRDKKDADLNSIFHDSRGSAWEIHIGRDSVGLLVQSLDLRSNDQIRQVSFNSLYEDREGSMWLATDGQGLYRLRRQSVTVFSKEDGLPDRNIYSILQDHAGAIWIGTWNGGLACYRDGRFTTVPVTADSSTARINSIFEDSDGVLWVATPFGLYKRERGGFHRVDSPQGDSARAIHRGREGSLWIGTGQGLFRLRRGAWSAFTVKDGLASDDVRVILDGSEGNIWFGGYGGLTSLRDGRFQHWTEADGLPSNGIRSLYEDRDGVLWIGTYDGGLGRFKDGKFSRFTMRDGLFSNGVFQILEDSRGYLWMSCNRGIYRVAKSELNDLAAGKRTAVFSTAFGRSEGMRNAECNGGLGPAGIRARDGKLWFPTQDGVAVIDPEAVPANPVAPPVMIESVAVDGRPRPLDRPIRVAPGDENLAIEYTALSFLDSERIRFRYILEGLDTNWVDAYTRRTAYYSHLPPGRYTFRAIAANNDGVWDTQGQSLAVLVLPPFYRTWWFLALALVGVLAATALAWHLRVLGLKQAHAAQQAFTRRLIASQENERRRISAEMHDGLGQQLVIIKNLALMSMSHGSAVSDSRAQIAEISEQATQAISEVKKISYNLRPYQLDRLGLTKAIEGILQQARTATNIEFDSEIDPIDQVFAKESEINFYRIVQESVNNVIKHSQASLASVAVRHSADEILLAVRDNGKGLAPGAVSVTSEGGGFGMMGISERAQSLGGRVTVHSEPGNGTIITVRIPLRANGHGQ